MNSRTRFPLVSVLMTAYNREKYLAEAIESVLSSTYKNFELIVVDDCSSDHTLEIAKKFEKIDQRVKVYFSEKNLGQFANRNKALQYVNGDLIKFFDSDDVMFSDFITIMVDAMQSFPEALAGGGVHKSITKTPVIFSPREMYVSYFNGINLLSIIPSSVIFKKEVFDILGGFSTNVGVFADTLFLLKARARFPWVGFESNKFFYRVHEGQQMDIGTRDKMQAMIYWHNIKETVLNSEFCPLTSKEIKIVKRNSKNITIRNNISSILKGNFKFAFDVQKEFRFTMADYVKAALPNKRLLY